MDRQQLREQLEQLYAELKQVETSDAKEQEMFNRLARDIEKILEGDVENNEHLTGFGERLRDTVVRYEATHPRAALFMRELIDQLSVLGI